MSMRCARNVLRARAVRVCVGRSSGVRVGARAAGVRGRAGVGRARGRVVRAVVIDLAHAERPEVEVRG